MLDWSKWKLQSMAFGLALPKDCFHVPSWHDAMVLGLLFGSRRALMVGYVNALVRAKPEISSS